MALFKIARRFCSRQVLQQYLQESANNKGFDRVISKVNILVADKGNCVAELNLQEEHLNPMQTLHGGLSATLVDCITTYALMTHEKAYLKPSVSVDMHFTYFKSASLGETIVVDAKTLRVGKTLGFLDCEIRNKKTGDILVKGSHTKFLIGNKS